VRATFASVHERLPAVPEEASSGASEPSRRLDRRSVGLGVAIAIAVATAAGLGTRFVTERSSTSNQPRVAPTAPVALSASGLKTLAGVVGQPIYWAGPRKHYLYELKRTANRNVYIRYLPPGVNAGAPGHRYTIIATYPVVNALAALKKVAGRRGIDLPGGGIALVVEKQPTLVHLAFPKVDYQVEVYDPSPARALALATSGQVRPA
jgi:hypothetical protein